MGRTRALNLISEIEFNKKNTIERRMHRHTNGSICAATRRMKSISTKSKKGSGLTILMVLAAIAMVSILLFTVAKKTGLLQNPGEKAATPENTISVAYLEAAAASGTPLSECVSYRDVNLDTLGMALPDDVLTADDPIDGYVLKIDLFAGTTLSQSMVCPVDTEDKYNATTREVDITYVNLQKTLSVGDYIDIRMKVSNTANSMALQDDIVLAKKEVIALDNSTITLRLNEDEQILLTAAAVECTITNASKDKENAPQATLSTTRYVSYAQPAATVTYRNDEAVALMRSNPNLINNPAALYEALTGQSLTNNETPVE